MATSIGPREDPSVTPRTPAGPPKSLGASHSIPTGQGAVGLRHAGFVHRLCIRKADEARVRPRTVYGLADTRFCRQRRPTEPGWWAGIFTSPSWMGRPPYGAIRLFAWLPARRWPP